MWPGGRVEEWSDVPIDQFTWLTEGQGQGASVTDNFSRTTA